MVILPSNQFSILPWQGRCELKINLQRDFRLYPCQGKKETFLLTRIAL